MKNDTTSKHNEINQRLDENRSCCKHIADELEAHISGNVRRCPDCGETLSRSWDDVGDKFRCPSCGAVADFDSWDQLTIWDYLSDCLDVEFRVSGKHDDEPRSVRVMVACGGPNIYIDSASAAVKLYWWTERAEWPISYDARDALNEWAAEYWGCL